jgi:two-component system osmolarity sensor histidine kinase EnvZ
MPRRRLWRAFFWIALIAILVEVVGLTSTFVELGRRRAGDAAGLVPDQIAAVVHLWPSLGQAQRKEVLAAISGANLNFHVTPQAPIASPDTAHVREIEDAVRKRLSDAGEDSVVALIHARAFGRDRHAANWALSSEPVRVYVRLAPENWLVAEVRGDLLTRFLGLPTGFWVGVVGMLLASGVLLVILREGRAVERIAGSVEAFAATGVPQPIAIGGSPEIAGLGRRMLRMQEQVATLLNERNAMLGAIAHDVKTYIQRLKLRLEVLDVPDQLQKAERDLDAMDKLVEDALLVAVHANPLKSRETVDLLAIVSHEVEAARLAGGEVAFNREDSGPLLVSGDRSALSRALANIIGNALRYGRQARVLVRRNKGTAEIIIDDDGPGIPPSEREAVFKAFHRSETSRNRSTGGTGLGLAIAHGIIERQHGGSIEITDAPGAGARVKACLPILRSAAGSV